MLQALLEDLENHYNQEILPLKSVSGGDINKAYSFTLSNRRYFLKYNTGQNHQALIKSEVWGLKALALKGLSVPKIEFELFKESYSALVLNWIDARSVSENDGELIATNLRQLHSNRHKNYGLEHHNYIGRWPQSNSEHHTFSQFYSHERLIPQIEMAHKCGWLSFKISTNHIDEQIRNLIPEEKPTLIHGDLWSGNYLIDKHHQFYFIDPSISYAHREMDIAMMHLFGGFPSSCYAIYNEMMPMEKGWQNRMDIFQLYYLLVHLNLFGLSYRRQVDDILNKYFI